MYPEFHIDMQWQHLIDASEDGDEWQMISNIEMLYYPLLVNKFDHNEYQIVV
jgi:hypothetical protein